MLNSLSTDLKNAYLEAFISWSEENTSVDWPTIHHRVPIKPVLHGFGAITTDCNSQMQSFKVKLPPENSSFWASTSGLLNPPCQPSLQKLQKQWGTHTNESKNSLSLFWGVSIHANWAGYSRASLSSSKIGTNKLFQPIKIRKYRLKCQM